jgi:hypothetical protein
MVTPFVTGNSGPNGEWLEGPESWGTLPVICWRVWYADGSDVKAEDPADLPTEGVEVVCAHHPGGRRTFCTSKDAYLLPGVRLLGKWMPTLREFQALYDRAVADPWRP